MPAPKQGEIWWAELPNPVGRRPVLILTRTGAIEQFANVTIAPLTRTIRQVRSEVNLSTKDGVPTDCAITLENIITIRKAALDRKITRVRAKIMSQVFEAVRFVFQMP